MFAEEEEGFSTSSWCLGPRCFCVHASLCVFSFPFLPHLQEGICSRGNYDWTRQPALGEVVGKLARDFGCRCGRSAREQGDVVMGEPPDQPPAAMPPSHPGFGEEAGGPRGGGAMAALAGGAELQV